MPSSWKVPNPVRDLLNELRWHPDREPAKACIFYANRNSPEGFVMVRGNEVAAVGSATFRVDAGISQAHGSTIPLYKVFRITYDGEVLLERPRGDE